MAQMDPEIDLSGLGSAYVPSGASSSYLENETPLEKKEEEDEKAAESKAGKEESVSADETKKTIDASTIPGSVKSQQEAPRA